MFALVMVFSSWIRNVDTKDNVDQVCRKYMLKMETQGYLTTDMQKDLENNFQFFLKGRNNPPGLLP